MLLTYAFIAVVALCGLALQYCWSRMSPGVLSPRQRSRARLLASLAVSSVAAILYGFAFTVATTTITPYGGSLVATLFAAWVTLQTACLVISAVGVVVAFVTFDIERDEWRHWFVLAAIAFSLSLVSSSVPGRPDFVQLYDVLSIMAFTPTTSLWLGALASVVSATVFDVAPSVPKALGRR